MKRIGDRQSDRIILDIRILSIDPETGRLYMRSAADIEVRSLEMEVQMALKIGQKILYTRKGTKSVPETARASEPGQMTRERK